MQRSIRFAVGAAYAAQGLGYATVVTTLPTLKARVGIDNTVVSLLLLGVCVMAAAGSLLADAIAVWRDSRVALVAGLWMQVVGLAIAAFADSLGILIVAIACYGLGLGTVDAANNMQGAIAERHRDAPLFGKLYASYTTAAIVGTVITAAVLTTTLLPTSPILVAAAVALVVGAVGIRAFSSERAARRVEDRAADRPRLPAAGIWIVGALVFAAFAVDSAVSAWSTVYLADGLDAAPGTTPLGYAAYLVAVLVARLVSDPAARRFGRARTALVAAVLGILGLVAVAVLPSIPAAIAGFALSGFAAGALVPLAFSRAGELLPARSDEVMARVNLFNYGGAVAGAVLLGLVGSGPTLAWAFLIPAAVLALALPALRALRPSRQYGSSAAPSAPPSVGSGTT
ncbi:MFS transporter [Microbacterium sp. X-17]|uniref:MFS transporter n=1 Tax=Microbacterium sp. X-17 TaxID=3144404 RepID=UPI0031F57F69